MKRSIKSDIISFPENYSDIECGLYLKSKSLLLTGHKNGFVISWDLKKKQRPKVILDSGYEIRSIVQDRDVNVIVASRGGDIISFKESELRQPRNPNYIYQGDGSKRTRSWTLAPLKYDSLTSGSTYGKLRFHFQENDRWDYEVNSKIHNDAIFALAASKTENLFATGDWGGNIYIWGYKSPDHSEKHSKFYPIARANTLGTVKDLCFLKDGSFVSLSENGTINYFERENGNKWRKCYNIDISSGFGKCITISKDQEIIIAGSSSEILFFNIESMLVDFTKLRSKERAVKIFPENDKIIVLTNERLYKLPIPSFETTVESVRFKYSKISIIGLTEVGKSTLCKMIIMGSHEGLKSTYGKHIWTWELDKGSDVDTIDRRIIFHDHGGQTTVISTFIPFLVDSNVIILMFSMRNKHSLKLMENLWKQLEEIIVDDTKIIILETHIDEDVDETRHIKENVFEETGLNERSEKILRINTTDLNDVDKVKKELIKILDWDFVGIMIRSEITDNFLDLVSELQDNPKVKKLSVKEIQAAYEEKYGARITLKHLRFLFSSLADQGMIDFLKKETVIFNDKGYNMLKSKIPIFADSKGGVVPFELLKKKISEEMFEEMAKDDRIEYSPEYVDLIDEIYLSYRVSIKFTNDILVFPVLLSDKELQIPDEISSYLEKGFHFKGLYERKSFSRTVLTDLLAELKLLCIDMSRTEGLLTFSDYNACLYYKINENIGDKITGQKIEVTFYIGGTKPAIMEKLVERFSWVLNVVLGESIESDYDEVMEKIKKKRTEKKKKDLKIENVGLIPIRKTPKLGEELNESIREEKVEEVDETEGVVEFDEELDFDSIFSLDVLRGTHQYDVALSFAGEQREFANSLFKHLEQSGIDVFYDKKFEGVLWGKKLTFALKKIFFNSSFAIVLNSKQYREKIWPKVEWQTIVSRSVLEEREYALVVSFDDEKLEGIDHDVVYLKASENTPKEIASAFIQCKLPLVGKVKRLKDSSTTNTDVN